MRIEMMENDLDNSLLSAVSSSSSRQAEQTALLHSKVGEQLHTGSASVLSKASSRAA